MEQASARAWALVEHKVWSKDKYDRWASACFRSALQHRVGDELWAKLFLVVGKVNAYMVALVNENFAEPQ